MTRGKRIVPVPPGLPAGIKWLMLQNGDSRHYAARRKVPELAARIWNVFLKLIRAGYR